MISEQEIKKIREYARGAIEDGHSGITITLAMDPVVMFALTGELLRLRKLQQILKNAVEAGNDRRVDQPQR